MSHDQRRYLALAVLGIVLSLLGNAAAAADTLRDRVEACAANRDDAARLRCFDEVAGSLSKEKAAADAKFGAKEPREPPPAVLSARVVSVSQPNGRNYRVVLDNDQVWQETEHVRDMELTPGQAVRIKPGVLGSFFLIAESGRSTRVRRIR